MTVEFGTVSIQSSKVPPCSFLLSFVIKRNDEFGQQMRNHKFGQPVRNHKFGQPVKNNKFGQPQIWTGSNELSTSEESQIWTTSEESQNNLDNW